MFLFEKRAPCRGQKQKTGAVAPTDLTGGERAAPPVLAFGSPDRPPPGTASPNAFGIGSPFPVSKKEKRRPLARLREQSRRTETGPSSTR